MDLLCELLTVSRSGFYKWKKPTPSQRAHADVALAAQVAQGLQGRCRRRSKPRTTDSRHAQTPAPNRLVTLLPPTGPDQIWVTDITYIETGEGWLYLAAILDLWSRRIVGWACAPTLHTSLVLCALARALKNRRPTAGLVHHSDRGVQYVSDDYRAALKSAGIERSMSRAGNCYDNAAMESFWSTIKLDTSIDQLIPPTRLAAELAVFDYIETFYNLTSKYEKA